MGLYVMRTDRTVQHLLFWVNPAAARELEAWESLARKIAASVSEGETSLASEAPRELRFAGLAVTAPDGYVATNDRGPDFSVYHLRKMTEFGEPPCSLNVYVGGYPKALPTGPLVKTSDAVLFGASAQWREIVRTFPAGYTENSEPVISTEAIFLLRRDPPPLYAHIFLESGNSAQTDELKQIAASLRLTPQSSTMATHPEGNVGLTRTQIRVRNSSDVDFQDVEVDGKKYGDVKAGATTGYEEVWGLMSRYAAVSLVAGSQPMTIQPIGEPRPGDGLSRLTYVLSIRDGRLNIAAESEPATATVVFQPIAPDRAITDELAGATIGVSHGIRWIRAIKDHGAEFSARDSSRIEYPGKIPREGTLELWIKVNSGYQYSNFNLSADQDHAVIFSTDVQGGDVTWPGTCRLDVSRNGDVSLFIATSKYNRPAASPTETHGTKFRFGEWHAIGISYGGQGQFIMVDGAVVASAPNQTHWLGSSGNHQFPLDVPTIGETVSHFWAPHQYEGGFEGVVARVRVSPKQQDWDLARSIKE
jgi:hypothetical protein